VRSFDGLALRQLRTRPLRALLTGFGVVLGVGMVFGVLLLVTTIRHTFDDLLDSAFGNTQLVVSPTAGTLSQSTLERVRSTPGVRDAGGMVGGLFTRLDAHGRPVEGPAGKLLVAGYDPRGFPPYDFKLLQGRWQRAGPEVILERNWARDRGLAIGDSIPVATPSGPARLDVVGIFRFSSGLSFGGQGLAAMTEQAERPLIQQPSGWWQISVAAADRRQVDGLAARLRARLGPGADVKTPRAVGDDIKGQLDALNVVLYFFSGVALFVGGFLILNAFNMTVLQRMRELGLLRTLGASRWMVTRTVLTEALVIGVAGSLLGLALGIGLAAGLIELMKGLGIPIGSLQVTSGAAIAAVLTGLLVTAGAAFWPARRAGRIAPIEAVLGGRQARARPGLRRGLLGLALFLPGLLLGGHLWMGGTSAGAAMGGMVVTIAMFVGMSLAAPFVITPLVRALAIPLRWLAPAGGRLAADAARGNPLRTAATAAALTIGLSVVVVNGSMSASFLGTIRDQVDANFARDVTIHAQGYSLDTGGGPGVPGSLAQRVRRMPEVGAVTPVRALFMKLPASQGRQGLVVAYDPASYGKLDRAPIRGATRETALRDVARGGVIVGSQYANAAHLKVGDTVTLSGAGGRRQARVAGVLGTLAAFNGLTMQMSLDTMRGVYGWANDAELAVRARDDAARAPLERRLAAIVRHDYPNLELQSAADVKHQIETEITRQFNLFNAIIAIAVIVSLLGVVNTLAMSVLERTREIGVMRALGASRWQVRQTMLDESLLITGAGALAGLGIGALIGWVWMSGLDSVLPGLTFHFPWATAASVAVAAVVLGVLAAVLPARRAARLEVISALKYE
jgi:putative ABC transport system permease protein